VELNGARHRLTNITSLVFVYRCRSILSWQTRADMAAWTGCIAGALTETEFRHALAAAGLEDVEIRETHRVHEHAAAAIIRARKPE
jgi:hypothetical protein